MRISSHQAQQVAIESMLDQQSKLSKVQQQVATGRKIFRPSDDPVAAAKIVNLRDLLATTEQYQDNIHAAQSRLTLEEGILDNAGSVLQRIRELAVNANNDTLTPEDRSFIAEEVKQLQSELFNLANMTDSSGEYLFSGSKSKFRPFNRNQEGSFDYHGDEGQRFLQIGPQRQIATSDSGDTVFRNVKDGNGEFTILDSRTNRGSAVVSPGNRTGDYNQETFAIVFAKQDNPDGTTDVTYKVIDSKGESVISAGTPYQDSGLIELEGINTFIEGEPEDGDFFVIRPSNNQDIFTTIQGFVDALEGGGSLSKDRAALHNEINRFLTGVDLALGNVLEVRANVGARLNALDGQKEINDSYILQVREVLSEVEDLDYGEAVSDLNLKLTGLEASQKAFTRVQGISLFNYL